MNEFKHKKGFVGPKPKPSEVKAALFVNYYFTISHMKPLGHFCISGGVC